MGIINRLANTSTGSRASPASTADWNVSHTVPSGTNLLCVLIAARVANTTETQIIAGSVTYNSVAMTADGSAGSANADTVGGYSVRCHAFFLRNPSTGTNTLSITSLDADLASISYVAFNLEHFETLGTLTDHILNVTGINGQTVTQLSLSNSSSFEGPVPVTGEYQFVYGLNTDWATPITTTNDQGWAEIADFNSGTAATDIHISVYDTDSFTGSDIGTITITFSSAGGRATARRAWLQDNLRPASGTPSIFLPTASGSTKRPPRVYLNTTQTKAGATELPLVSYNDAGTSLTFQDPLGPPYGPLFLGIENTSTHFIDWQAVTVTGPPQASGTPSITAIEAAGTADRNSVEITDVANSGETPGAGSETWNDGSSGNVITGKGFTA